MTDFDSKDFCAIMEQFGDECGHMELESYDTFSEEYEDESTDLSTPSSESSSGCSVSISVKPKRKRVRKSTNPVKSADPIEVSKWKYKYVKHDLTRQIKNDNRKDYMTMFTNVSNSYDFAQYFSYLATYCSKDFLQHQTLEVHSDVGEFGYGMPKISQTIGIQNAAQQFYNEMQIMPDMVSTIKSVELLTYSNTKCSKIVSNIHFATTRLYDVPYMVALPPDSIITHHNDVTELSKDHFIHTLKDTNQSNFEYHAAGLVVHTGIHNLLDRSPMLREPQCVEIMAKVTMHLDKDRRIERLDFDIVSDMSEK